ncbi:MAG: hypothetical protein IKJ59_12380 [Clostridia bacterium]|jgi:uncharacterized circularly permuted ATP-grasp superfamily protein|nr:hypothetical protein [Clostridia bacterium]
MSRTKTKRFTLRLSDSEYETIMQKFKDSEYKSVSKFFHDTIYNSEKKYKRYTDIDIWRVLSSAVKELNMLGNNINQSTHILNLKMNDITEKTFLITELKKLRENQFVVIQIANYIKELADKIEQEYRESL